MPNSYSTCDVINSCNLNNAQICSVQAIVLNALNTCNQPQAAKNIAANTNGCVVISNYNCTFGMSFCCPNGTRRKRAANAVQPSIVLQVNPDLQVLAQPTKFSQV